MAVVIRHGPNGSYKSASAVWYDLLPALRQGRICITNLEGCYPLEDIEKRLGEKFPDSTRLYRINIIHDEALRLWRRWFHWAPIGSFILMDEVQDIYPDKSWKESDLDYQPIDIYKDQLPSGLIEDYYAALDACKPDAYDTCDYDDTGSLLFDSDGRIVYPKTLNGGRQRTHEWLEDAGDIEVLEDLLSYGITQLDHHELAFNLEIEANLDHVSQSSGHDVRNTIRKKQMDIDHHP